MECAEKTTPPTEKLVGGTNISPSLIPIAYFSQAEQPVSNFAFLCVSCMNVVPQKYALFKPLGNPRLP